MILVMKKDGSHEQPLRIIVLLGIEALLLIENVAFMK